MFATATQASAFLVATNGNDANPGTKAQPWKTIQKAMNSAPPGSIVSIRGGTYKERLTINVSGTAGKYSIFQPYGFTGERCGGYSGIVCRGEKVVLDYASFGPVSDGVGFLTIVGKSYVKIQGLTFQNCSKTSTWTRGVRIDASRFIEIRHNKFLRNTDPQPWDGTSALGHFWMYNGAHNIVIDGNEFGHIVSNYGETLTAGADASAITIENNYIHDTDGIAINMQNGASNWVIRGNLLEYVSRKRDGTIWHNLIDLDT